jgi:hypothetical protein
MTGNRTLFEDDVNPAMSAALDSGLELVFCSLIAHKDAYAKAHADLQDQSVERFGPVTAPRRSSDEPLGRRDFSIHAAHPHLGAVETAPDEVLRRAL